jgi:hypothetical protein
LLGRSETRGLLARKRIVMITKDISNKEMDGIANQPAPQPIAPGLDFRIILPILILLLSFLPVGSPTLTFEKALVGGLLFFLTIPAVLAGLVGKIRVAARGFLLAFLISALLNIVVVILTQGSFSRWVRYVFGSYIFVAMIFVVASSAKSPQARRQLWMIMALMLGLGGILEGIWQLRQGMAYVWEMRALGVQPLTSLAILVLFPALVLLRRGKIWLGAAFLLNVLLLLLSATRGYYIMLMIATAYIIWMVHKEPSKRIMWIISSLVILGLLMTTPIFDRMYQRFSVAIEGTDRSTLGRVDEVNSIIKDVSKSWGYILFGKGLGAPFKVEYLLSHRERALDKTALNNPHNEYAARLLYTGITGLFIELLLYWGLWRALRKSIRQPQTEMDPHTQVRIHGAILMLLTMVLFGFTGAVFYYWYMNIFQACIIGIGLADATVILSKNR